MDSCYSVSAQAVHVNHKALFRDCVQRGRVITEHCPTSAQITDMWTKQVGQGAFVGYRGRFMGLVPFLRN